ncbi:hypothetical protein [Paenibacillus silviterrae]|uniref:hypothetical protein n=1 Tax=Paenibacillus silviterrae TaxID=3242194 RepID=UPI00254350A1|nr:hypothetical protein [Paenibacillus chinjuensis]
MRTAGSSEQELREDYIVVGCRQPYPTLSAIHISITTLRDRFLLVDRDGGMRTAGSSEHGCGRNTSQSAASSRIPTLSAIHKR